MSTLNEVRDIFVQICGLDEGEINPDTNMSEDVKIDSIDFMDATYEIDQKYGIKLPLEDWINDINVGKKGAKERFTMSNICSEIEKLRAVATA